MGFTLQVAFAQHPLPDDFNLGVSGSENASIYSLAVQADERILVGGSFEKLGGQPRNGGGRLNADGSLDLDFNPGLIPSFGGIYSWAVQADGKTVVGGYFTSLGGQPRSCIGRLNADGTVDTDFNVRLVGGGLVVSSLAVQADGKILVGGNFQMLNGPRCIGRLNVDGTPDGDFKPQVGGEGAGGSVYSLMVQTDGKILVGLDDAIARLNADGTLDTDFNWLTGVRVYSFAAQSDGKILVGGFFGMLGEHRRSYLGRLNGDGTPDPEFNPGADGTVKSLMVQTDGKILVGGNFTTLGGQPRSKLGRLNADGTPDPEFNPGADGAVESLILQADGKILAGGNFTTLGGQSRSKIGRLNSAGPATQSLDYYDSTITWLRGGSSPEVWRTTFESSLDGLMWTKLGEGTRISGGWQLKGISLPTDSTLRARGHVSSGNNSWPIEAYFGRLVLLSQPTSRTNDAGTTAIFYVTVAVDNAKRLGFQWYKNDVPLVDGRSVSGAQTSMLTVDDVLKEDEGNYTVVVVHQDGILTSHAATLTVRDPVITVQPVSQDLQMGENTILSLVAVGTSPLKYQWWHNGAQVVDATNSTLALTDVQSADSGMYTVVVSNQYGSETSEIALLAVNPNTLDNDFNPGADDLVTSMVLQVDGKILVGGNFTMLGGQPRNHIGRLNADGTLDSNFTPAAIDPVSSMAVQADGKIVVGSYTTTPSGQAVGSIGRLNADGTLDSDFKLGANAQVTSLLVLADGRILAGGSFTTLGGQPRGFVGRLNSDGTLDNSFNPGANGEVESLVLQADGKLLVGGYFDELGGQSRLLVGRLNADGTLDSGFNPGAEGGGLFGSGGGVSSLVVQADGKILVGGDFTTLAGQPRRSIGRLNFDGTLDSDFNPGLRGDSLFGARVTSLVVQANGKILVGGYFEELGGQLRSSIGRLNADGTLDGNFNPGMEGSSLFGLSGVPSLLVQADGKTLVGGDFATLGGQPRSSIGRLNSTTPATQSLAYNSGIITWLRGGSSPEISRASFEFSPDGAAWQSIGSGTRISGGWQLAGVSLPDEGKVRAQGQMAGDGGNSSGWVETILDLSPVISNHAPTFPTPIRDLTSTELVELRLTDIPADDDLPAQKLTVVLFTPPGARGATYDQVSGTFHWKPSEADGPGTYDFALVVTDNGVPVLSATNAFRITVAEENLPPTVTAPTELRGHEGVTLGFVITAADPDLLADGQTNQLIFEITPLPPSATFDPRARTFSWTIPAGTAAGTNIVQVTVKDNGEPPLEAKRDVVLVVEPPPVSAFTLENVRFDSGTGSVVFDLRLPLGTRYGIERVDSVDDTSWELAGTWNVTSSPTTVVVPTHSTTQGYLRVRLE